ncbi:hypothetical protein RHGRI_038847 [Rhododendron griersonianum]|uniref:SWIM-type domain-containing protein n=1 Tax=Rhododendron griersonianum TaxID=479676 RepID=A0AAV6HM49_9ERIC|nr:hypothetical protein RHGRI_038847 [Rhododendron griersonianum]
MISNAAGLPYNFMKITYRFPSIRFPNPTYQHVALDIRDNTGVDLIFVVHGEIPGYVPILFIESMSVQACPGIVQEHLPGESSQPQHYDNETTFGDFPGQCSQYRYNYDTTSFQGQSSAEFPCHDTTFHGSASQLHDELIQEEHEGSDEERDEGSESSLEDVDAALEADGLEDDYIDGQGNTILAHKPPCPMYMQDTWSNIIDPSPPMPTRSHLGWDGRSEFFEGQLFSSKDELQCAMKKFCMARNYVVKTDKSSPNLLSYKCNNKTPCEWRLRASIKANSDMWKVTKYTGPHSCLAVNVTTLYYTMLDARYMANEMTEIIGSNFSTKIKTLQLFIKKLTEGYMPSYSKTWAAKQLVISRQHGDWDLSHATLPVFLQVLEQANPGTRSLLLYKDSGLPGCATFDRLFWAFAPAIEGFKHSRSVISVDGTFLTGRYKGTLLVAVTQDAENQIMPIAFAIVEKEDRDNWGWFLTCIRHFVTKRQGLCLISDRHSGLMSWLEDDSAYDWRPPHAYHRYCLRHLGSNYHRRFGKLVGKEVKVCAMECQKKKFKAKLTRLKRFANELIYQELNLLNKKQWTFAYDGGRRYGSETTNCSESFNGVVKEARHLPIMATVMFTFYKCVEYFDDRLVQSMDTKAKGNHFSLYAKKKYDHWRENAVGHNVIVFNRAAGLFEVHTPINRTSPYKGNNKHTVDLTNKTCTCNKIQLWKIPCSHVIAVCNKMHIDPLDYFGKYWTVDTTIAMYGSLSFKPLPDQAYWPSYDGPRILPDKERLRGRGRPKVNRIRNEMDDLIEHQPPQTCSKCGQQGHNKRRCGK